MDTSLSEFPDIDFPNVFYDIIGPIGYLIPRYYDGSIFDGPFPGPLKCYEDPNLGLVKFIAEDCDYLETTIQENIPKSSLSIYPNPASNKICIDLNLKDYDLVECYNISGNKINFILNRNGADIPESDISDLPDGIYFLRIMKNNQTIATGKFIKN